MAETYTLGWKEAFGDTADEVVIEHHLVSRSFRRHDHEFFEIILVRAGFALHRTPSGEGRAHAGAVTILRPGAWHEFDQVDNLEVTNICFPPRLWQSVLREVREAPPVNAMLAATLGDGALSFRLAGSDFARCLRLADAGAGSPAWTRIGVLIAVLGVLSEAYGNEVAHEPGPGRIARPVLAAIRALEGDLAHDWNLADLETLACLDRSHLSRQFRAATGYAPMEYLDRLRVEKAAALLRQSDLTVSEVGERVGIRDANYFARRFRQATGLSPTAYRAGR